MKCEEIIVPEYKKDECKGCYTLFKCVTITEDIPYLNIKKGDTLAEVIFQLTEKIRALEN